MASEQTIDGSKAELAGVPETEAEETAEDLATLTANRPLQLLNEELGSDPYNRTGRFSKPTGE